MDEVSAEEQLAGFLSKYTPEIAARARTILAKMRAQLPGAVELVYDNYNALAIGFGPTERTSDLVFSIAVFPRWVSLFFMAGARLPDPQHVLAGKGKTARHVVLHTPDAFDTPAVQILMAHALRRAAQPFDPRQPNRIVIKSISARQRPRRPF